MSEKVEAKPNALWENIKVIIQALILAMVIRTVLFQPFTIPSGSMMPTLLVGDYIFVNKFAYGYSKYSLPFSPDVFSGRLFGADPKRGDIVVFRFPPNPDIDYIKRCIGLPGDRIQVTDGVLYVNGKPVPKVADGAFTSDYKLDPGEDVRYSAKRSTTASPTTRSISLGCRVVITPASSSCRKAIIS